MSRPNPYATRDQLDHIPAVIDDWMDASKAQATMTTLIKAAQDELAQSQHQHRELNHHAASIHTVAAESALKEAGRIEAALIEYQARVDAVFEVPC